MSKNPQSLKRHLMLWLLIPLFLVLIISAFISYSRALYFANLAYDRALFRAALALSDQVDVVGTDVVADLPEVARDLLVYDKDDIIFYRITTPDGIPVIGDEAIPKPEHLPTAGKHIYYDAKLGGKPVRVVAFSLPIINAKITGNILVQVAETRSKRDALVTEIVEEMLFPQLIIMLLTAGLIFFALSYGLLPLKHLQDAINQRSYRDLSKIESNDAPSEFQPLLSAMNNLIGRVREAAKLQQQFIADASHQMRTPIAGLQTQAELALREKDPNIINNTLELVLTSASRLSHLLGRLLTMASVDPAAGREATLAEVDLIALAKKVTSDFINDARKKNIDLGLDIQATHAQVHGDEIMLHEMLANLIDNAICYTPEKGIITVCITQTAEKITLSVMDNGIGIPPEQRSKVFERFHRLLDNEGKGVGLGLAIVREIVLAHEAEITIDDGIPHKKGKGVGTKVNVVFNTQTKV